MILFTSALFFLTYMLKHILFDLDHTLWDFDGNSHLAKIELYHKFHLANIFSSFDEFVSIYTSYNTRLWSEYAAGQTNKDNVSIGRFYYPMLDKGYDNYELARQIADFYLQNTAQRTSLMPNTLNTLDYLCHKYTLHIITNGFVEVQYKKIKLSGLDKYIKGIFISDEIGAMKPSKEFFNYVLNSINATCDECIIIGDSPESDIAGGHLNNIKTIYYNSRNINCQYPTTTIHDLIQLTELL